MLVKKNHINIRVSKFLFIIIFLFLDSFTIAQSKANLEVFFGLVDSSVVKINNTISSPVKEVKINFNSGNYFSVFQDQVLYDFVKLGRTVVPDSPTSSGVIEVNYTLERAVVEYGDMERDGFFGGFYLPRKVKVEGSYSVKNNIVTPGNFNFTYRDTVAVDDIKILENPSFTFTQGDVPPEPFLSNLFEPVVAIGSAAIAVILFFTIRSK